MRVNTVRVVKVKVLGAQTVLYRSVAQFGSAHGLGPWGRGFESLHSDQETMPKPSL